MAHLKNILTLKEPNLLIVGFHGNPLQFNNDSESVDKFTKRFEILVRTFKNITLLEK